MKRVLRWMAVGFGGVAIVAACAGGGALAASEVMIRWPQAKPEVRMTAASDPAAVARGRQVAVLNGCHDCHGDALQGKLFQDEMPLIRAWGPNLTLAAAGQSDAELDRAIRHGVAADGRPLWVMPSSAFALLTDREAADLLAYVRSFPVAGKAQPRLQVGPIGRLGILMGQFKSEPAMLQVNRGLVLPDLGPGHEQGREIARACVECHGAELKGGGVLETPDLTIAASYEPEDFARLMHTGVAAGDRQVGLMSEISRTRFTTLSDQEVVALYGYLKARAARIFAEADAAAALPKP